MLTDTQRLLAVRSLRSLAYGFGSVLLGASLQSAGWTSFQVGLLLTAILAGTALMSFLVGTFADRIGRRRAYVLLFAGLTLSFLAFGLTSQFVLLLAVALTGTLSTEIVEAGPFTSLEQAMLPAAVEASQRNRMFGVYNATAALAGSIGALLSGVPALINGAGLPVVTDHRLFLVVAPISAVAAVLAGSLSDRVEEAPSVTGRRVPLGPSRSRIFGLAALFGVDAFGGGFVVQSFLVYWFTLRWHIPLQTLAGVFFIGNLLQAISFVLATRIARQIGLLNTMVFTHLPSHLLLAAIPLAPAAPAAVALLLGRFALSAMDVPARQAYLVALVEPSEWTAAAAYTTTARYAVRPLAPVIGGAAQQLAIGLPFFLGAGIKICYDLVLLLTFRRIKVANS